MDNRSPSEEALSAVRMVVVEPQGPLNVGAIARVMKNMGLGQLVLVNPQCEWQGEEARRMAVHAQDILAQAQVVPSLAAGLGDCQRVIATTARPRTLQSPLETPREALPWLLGTDLPPEFKQDRFHSALVFGREDRGLTNGELNLAHRFVKIPVPPTYPSLNLAQAVAICAYELCQSALASYPSVDTDSPDLAPPASGSTLQGYYDHLEKTLLAIEVLYPQTARAQMAKFQRIYQRAMLTDEEVALLRGILGQVDWLAQRVKTLTQSIESPGNPLARSLAEKTEDLEPSP